MKPKVLLYQIPIEKAKVLAQALSAMGIRTCQVAASDIDQSVGYLAGADGFEREETNTQNEENTKLLAGELLVMCGFSRMQFEMFMNFLKRKKICPGAVKAMLTDTNKTWPFSRLVREVNAEHLYISQQKNKKQNEKI